MEEVYDVDLLGHIAWNFQCLSFTVSGSDYQLSGTSGGKDDRPPKSAQLDRRGPANPWFEPFSMRLCRLAKLSPEDAPVTMATLRTESCTAIALSRVSFGIGSECGSEPGSE